MAGFIRDAITYLERASAAATGVADPNVNYTLGGLYLRVGQPEKATQALARVLSQSPGSRQARLRMAQAQAENKDLRGAITTLEEIVDDEPSVAAPLAQYQERAGLLREAADFLHARAGRRADEPSDQGAPDPGLVRPKE